MAYNNQIQSKKSLANFGKCTKQFAIGQILALILGVVLLIGLFYPLMNLILGGEGNMDIAAMLTANLILVIAAICIGLVNLVLWFRFFLTFRKAAKENNSTHLEQAYSYYLWSILLPFLSFALLLILFMGSVASLFGDYPDPTNYFTLNLMQAIPMLILLIPLIVLVVIIAVVTLQIKSAISLEDFAQELLQIYGDTSDLGIVKDGAKNIKIGIILQIVLALIGLSIIGSILAIIGYFKFGKGLENAFSGGETVSQPSEYYSEFDSEFGSEDAKSSDQTFTSQESFPSQETKQGRYCSYCGAPFESGQKFCSQCGNTL